MGGDRGVGAEVELSLLCLLPMPPPAAMSGGLGVVLLAPCLEGGVFSDRVLNVIEIMGATDIAHTLGMPSQTHGLRILRTGDLRKREGRQFSSCNHITNSLGLDDFTIDLPRLVRSEQREIEVAIFVRIISIPSSAAPAAAAAATSTASSRCGEGGHVDTEAGKILGGRAAVPEGAEGIH